MSDESEFVQKYGPVNVQYINAPIYHPLYTRPAALNYFHHNKLFRTKGERGSGRFELFLDLLYVGIVANLASKATEEATGLSLLQYVVLFLPAWQIWSDLRDFMDYYYNNDLTQKFFVLWILILLVVYANNANHFLDSTSLTGLVVGTYIIARVSSVGLAFSYSFIIEEHRVQLRYYFPFVFCNCMVLLSVIWIPVRAKIAVFFVCYCLDITTYTMIFTPWFKKKVGAVKSTAVNIEHEVDRFAAFYVIALGEFLYGIVAKSPAATGFNQRLARAILTLIIAYDFNWFYFNSEGLGKAVHALRRSWQTAMSWILVHIPLIGSLILAADAASEFTALNYDSTKKRPTSEVVSLVARRIFDIQLRYLKEEAEGSSESEDDEAGKLYSLQFFFTGGLCIALLVITILEFLDKDLDPPNYTLLNRRWRVLPRIPVAITILCLAFAQMQSTLLIGVTAAILSILLTYETICLIPTPETCKRFEREAVESNQILQGDTTGEYDV